jgi:hypothetical protein
MASAALRVVITLEFLFAEFLALDADSEPEVATYLRDFEPTYSAWFILEGNEYGVGHV